MSGRNFEPTREVTMYQAVCTNCGFVDDSQEFFAWSDDGIPVEIATDNGWFNTLGNRYETGELLCQKCQKCDVCGEPGYDVGYRLRCETHEDTEVGADA